MFVSDVSHFSFVGKVEPYFLSAGEEVLLNVRIFKSLNATIDILA